MNNRKERISVSHIPTLLLFGAHNSKILATFLNKTIVSSRSLEAKPKEYVSREMKCEDDSGCSINIKQPLYLGDVSSM